MVGGDTGGFDRKTLGPDEFARSVRQLAIDTHHFLSRSDRTMGEFIRQRRRFSELLGENQDWQHTDIERWLCNARQTLEARVLAGLANGFSVN